MTRARLAGQLRSREAALAAAAAGAALLVLLLSAPVLAAFHAQHQRISLLAQQLGTLRAEAAMAPAVEAQLSDLQRRFGVLPGAIRAPTTSAAQSQLQQTMEGIASVAGSSIRSAQMLPVENANGFQAVAIQYDMSVPMSRLHDLLYGIEAHVPYLFIDNVQISAAQALQPAKDGTSDPPLEVRWTVRGYRWSEAP